MADLKLPSRAAQDAVCLIRRARVLQAELLLDYLRVCPQDKILQSMGRGQGIVVTNDGATILKSLYVDNPAAKVLVGM